MRACHPRLLPTYAYGLGRSSAAHILLMAERSA